MKTDDLIAMLAAEAEPVDPRASTRRFRAALGAALLVTVAIVAGLLGVRPDIEQAAALPMFWVKILFPVLVASVALYAVVELGRPGSQIKPVPKILSILLAAIWTLAALSLMNASPEARRELVFGEEWLECLLFIPFLAIPVFAATFWAIKGMAPTRLSAAGAAAGLFAGAASAAVYAFHCPELAAAFIGVWYVFGMAIPAVIGGLIGPRVLHW